MSELGHGLPLNLGEVGHDQAPQTGEIGTDRSYPGNESPGIVYNEVAAVTDASFAFGQAQAKIRAFGVNRCGQAQAVVASRYAVAITPDAPVVWYRTQESSVGTAAKNEINPGVKDGTYGSGVDVNQTGPLVGEGKAIYLDGGANDYLTAGTTGSEISDTFTIEAWIKSDNSTITTYTEASSGTNGTAGQRYVWEPIQSGGNSGLGLSLGTNGLAVYEHGSGLLTPVSAYYTTLGTTWHYVVIVQSSGTAKIYLDGTLVHTGVTSGRTIVYAPNKLGVAQYGNFAGYVAEPAIYNTALSGTRIAAHYAAAGLVTATTYTAFGQAQAWIRTRNNAFGQAQAKIIAINVVACGQAQAFIRKSAGYGQAQADIDVSTDQYGQAQGYIKVVRFVYAQAAAKIKAIGVEAYGQALGLITTPYGGGQAAALIFPEGRPFGQAQARVQGVPRRFGMAKAQIRHFGYRAYGQAQAKIVLPIFSAQAQAYITSGRTGKNLQGIEERLNPLTQIRWTRDITLRPFELLPTPTAAQLQSNANAVFDWEITNAPNFISAINNNDDSTSVLSRGNFSQNAWISANAFTTTKVTGFDLSTTRIEGLYVWVKGTMTVGPHIIVSIKAPNGTYYEMVNRFVQFGTATFYSFTQKRPWDSNPWTIEDINNLEVTLWSSISGLPNDNTRVYDVWLDALLKGDGRTEIPATSLPDHAITHGLPGGQHTDDHLSIDPAQVIGLNITPGITHEEDVTVTAPFEFTSPVIIPRMFVHQVSLQRIRFLPIDRPPNPQEGDMYVDQGDMQPWIYTEDGWRTFAFEGMYGFGQPINKSGQAQAHMKGFPRRSANARAWIAIVTWAQAQARSNIRHVQGTGLALGNIAYHDNKQGYGQAQAFITTTASPRGTGQARAKVIVRSGALEILFSPTAGQVINGVGALAVYWKGNSFVAANILRGFSQAQAYILSPFFTVTWIGPAQAQAYILPRTGKGQAQALIV
jgi:hypothetical protein